MVDLKLRLVDQDLHPLLTRPGYPLHHELRL
jgi:hypothetical protein